MTTTKFRLKAGDFEIEVEGEQEYVDKKFMEISKKIFEEKTIPVVAHPIKQLVKTVPSEALLKKTDLQGIMEYTSDGKPHLCVPNPSKKLSLSEVMTLFLHTYAPQKMSLKDLQEVVSENWRSVPITAVSAVMATTLKGRVIRGGKRGRYNYTLSGSGREFVKDIIATKLKRKKIERK